MSESLEGGVFFQEPIELAQSSQQSIESLWKIGADVSKLYVSMAMIFSSFFVILTSAIDQERRIEKTSNDPEFTNSAFLFSDPTAVEGIKLAKETPTAIEAKSPVPYFILNLIVARKLSPNTESRLFKGSPKSAFFSNTKVPEISEIKAEAEKLETEEANQDNIIYRMMELQGKLQSKVTPSLLMLASVVERMRFPKKKVLSESLPLQSGERSKQAEYSNFAPINFAPCALDSFAYTKELPSFLSEQQPYSIKTAISLSNFLSGYSQMFSPLSLSSSSSVLTVDPSRFPRSTTERYKEVSPQSFVFAKNFTPNVFDAFSYARVLSFLVSGQQFSQNIKNGYSNFTSGISPIPSSSSSSRMQSSFPPSSLSSPASTFEYAPLPSPAIGKFDEAPIQSFVFAINFNPQIFDICRYAEGLPALVSQQQPYLKTSVHTSQSIETNLEQPVVRSKKVSLSRQNLHEERTDCETIDETRPQSIPASAQLTSTLIQASTSPILWVKGEADFLRRSGVSLLSVPIAASMAKRLFIETVVQPMLNLRSSTSADSNEVTLQNLKPTEQLTAANSEKSEEGYLSLNPFATKLSKSLSKYIVETQRNLSKVFEGIRGSVSSFSINDYYPSPDLAIGANLAANEPFKTEYEVINRENPVFAPSKIAMSALASVYMKKSRDQPYGQALSIVPKVLALAGAGNLIVKRLQHELAEFTKHEIAISTFGEALAELSIVEPSKAITLAEAGEIFAPSTSVEPYISREPQIRQSPPRPLLTSPTIQDTINLTVSADSSEDLRDLERKISRILSEQISRYYGSSRI